MGRTARQAGNGDPAEKTSAMTVDITAETHRRLQETARTAGKSVEEIATETLAAGIEKLKSDKAPKPNPERPGRQAGKPQQPGYTHAGA